MGASNTVFESVYTTTAPLTYSRQLSRRDDWLRELGELLDFPTISAMPSHRRDIEAAADWLKNHLAMLGLHHVQVLPGVNGGHPSVYADWLLAPGQPTLLLYGHYDVQPVDPLKDWRTPPFQATRIGQNLFARGASDDKGQLFIHLKAVESYLATVGSLPINVKIWLEGEEEINSPNLPAFLDSEATRLEADAVLVSDTEMLGPGRPTIIYGLRGSLAFELEVGGPRHDLHAGRYGGAVHNPVQALCEIIAGLHDRRGRVAIPEFYARVREVAATERQELRCGSPDDEQIMADLDIPTGWGEEGYSLFERMTIRPALIVNGIGNQDRYSEARIGKAEHAACPRPGTSRNRQAFTTTYRCYKAANSLYEIEDHGWFFSSRDSSPPSYDVSRQACDLPGLGCTASFHTQRRHYPSGCISQKEVRCAGHPAWFWVAR